jgi:hypothetical protein
MTVWHELLSVAIHAPSPHNVQPWRVRIINDNESELYIDSSRTLPKEDVTGSFIICAMGMFIEALTILAARKSYKLHFELLTEPAEVASAILQSSKVRLIPFAKLTLNLNPSGSTEGSYDESLFLKRRTSRLHLHEKEPSVKSIEDCAPSRKKRVSNLTSPLTHDRSSGF